MRLYAVTDRSWLAGWSLVDCVADALAGGATCVQLREKACTREVAELARSLQALCEQAGVPFIVNDHVELALEVGADGVHVGQEDMACERARAMLGREKIIGVSVRNREQAIAAASAGADYLGAGAVFATATKPESAGIGLAALAGICAAVPLPVVAIGGLNLATIPQLAHSGVAGAAVVSAIFAQDDIVEATKRLYDCTSVLLKKD